MRVWVDLANSPHPLLFDPVARALEERGHTVLVTARDHAQTLALAQERWPEVEVIGGSSPRGRVGKGRTLAARVAGLRSWARDRRPEVALSHNSYAQIVAARAAGVPAVTAMDFEHQPANHLAFRLARRILLPEAIPSEAVRRQGARGRKVRRYPGLKETLYVGDFEPDPEVAAPLGVELGPQTALVVARTPPSGAIYHRFGNPLFEETLRAACEQAHVRCVVLTRDDGQRRALRSLGLPRCTLPDAAVDARSLMYRADLVIGAGGTMSREAALMGVPTRSLFAGRQPAVDRWLEERGKLERLTSAAQLGRIERRRTEPRAIGDLRRDGAQTLAAFVEATVELS